MFRKSLTIFALIVAVGGLLVALVWQSGNFILGSALKATFEGGTGCAVSLRDPRLFLFPIRAGVRDVSIICPTDGAGEGFFARELITTVSLGNLLQKRLVLPEVEIRGVRSSSSGTDSAFFRTIKFIVEDEPIPDPLPWHALLTVGWKVVVAKTTLSPEPGTENLRLRFEPVTLTFREAAITLYDRPLDVLGFAESPALTISVRGRESTIIDTVDIDTIMGKAGISFNRAVGRVGDDPISISGAIDLKSDRYNLDLRSMFELSALPIELPEPLASVRAELSAELRGGLYDPLFRGVVDFSSESGLALFGSSNCDIRRVHSEFDIDRREFRLQKIDIEDSSDDGRLLVRFDQNYSLEGNLKISPTTTGVLRRCIAGGRIPELSLGVSGELSPLQGRAKLTARSSPERPTLDVDARMSDQEITVHFLDASAVAGGSALGTFLYRLRTSDIPTFEAKLDRYAGQRLSEIIGMIVPDLAGLDMLRQIVTPKTLLSGETSGSYSGEGIRLSKPLELRVQDASLFGIPVPSAKANIDLRGKAVSVNELEVVAENATLSGTFAMAENGALQGRFETDRLHISELAAWDALMPVIDAYAQASFDLRGTLDAPEGSGSITIDSSSSAGEKFAESNLDLRLTPEGVASDFRLFGSMIVGNLRIGLSNPYPMALRATVQNLRPDLFTRVQTTDLGGEIDGRIEIDGPIDDLFAQGDGTLSWETVEVRSQGQRIVLAHPTTWVLENGKVRLAPTDFVVANRPLRLEGAIDMQRGWAVGIHGEWKLATFSPYLSAVSQLSGMLSLGIDIVGPIGSPSASGVVSVRDGSFAFPLGSTVFGASAVEIDGVLGEGALTISRAEAQVGEGSAQMSGVIEDLFRESRSGSLNLTLKDIQLEPVEKLFVALESELSIRQESGRPLRIAGDVRITEGTYEDNVTMADLIRRLTRFVLGLGRPGAASIVRDRTAGEAVNLEIHVSAPESLLIDTNVAQAELRADFDIGGNSTAPQLTGGLEVLEGAFGLRSNSFDIIRGRVLFDGKSGTLDPKIDLVGESQVSADGDIYSVRLSVSGTVANPTVRFDSDGGLNNREIVSLLGGGNVFERIELVRSSRDQDLSTYNLLVPSSEATLEERFAGITGFTSVEIGPAYSKSTGEYVPKIFARRPLPAQLELELASELAAENRSTGRIEYRLSPFTVLSTGWKSVSDTDSTSGSVGSFSGGIHYRRPFPGVTLLPPEITRGVP